jgi:Na+-driven multidrug efflux pump
MTKDMTQGSPLKLILAFAVPLMLGSLFQQFYNLADTIIVGRFVGVDALAAVGSVGGLNYLVLGFVNGIACGFSIPISWTFGAKDYREMRRYTANAVWLSVFFAAVLTVQTERSAAKRLAGQAGLLAYGGERGVAAGQAG